MKIVYFYFIIMFFLCSKRAYSVGFRLF